MADGKPHPVLPARGTAATSHVAPPPPPKEGSLSPALRPRDGSLRTSFGSNSSSNHRQSLTDNLRGVPPSPRTGRQPSFSHAAIQELLNNPPHAHAADPAFAGRDWKTIEVGELIDGSRVRFVELDTGVEAATNLLIESGAPVILIREDTKALSACGTFDYADLNAYLLLVVGLAQPEGESSISSFQELAKKAREGNKIPIKDVKDLGKKEPFVALPHTARLTKAVECFGSGVHRIIILKDGTTEVVGILSQLSLVKFLWENGKSFPTIDHLYPYPLKDLSIGSHQVIAINGDQPLTHALELMNNEGLTSLAVIDNQMNVVGNISTVDVKHLTRSSSLPLLQSSCIHFISVILSDRGMNDGKDSFPVFYVDPYSTLAHTVAKLVATRSHRMWVVDAPSPASSAPPTPISQPAVLVPPPSTSVATTSTVPPTMPPTPAAPTYASVSPSPSVSASALPGLRMSGRLSGVVSLTDILNLFARFSGLSPVDPNEMRRQRRRSSSSSVSLSGTRPSLDSGRSSSVDVRR
ncbi:MAG: cell separation during budding [Caeruleum heppii]|nr:MAG: cell separation during budding [Caeruleum heppii]